MGKEKKAQQQQVFDSWKQQQQQNFTLECVLCLLSNWTLGVERKK
jgi:hypothetical protein